MKLSEAIAAMEAGKKVRSVTWSPWVYIDVPTPGGRVMDNNGDYYALHPSAVSSEWELFKELPRTYDFDWAVEQVRAGKMVRRASWHPSWSVSKLSGREISWEDIASTDWTTLEIDEK